MVWYIGINTGTSADAVDAALFCFQPTMQCLGGVSIDIGESLRNRILHAVVDASLSYADTQRLSSELGVLYCQAAQEALRTFGVSREQVLAIGLHGQTIHHVPTGPHAYSLQLNAAPYVASTLGVDVISDFRNSDIALGGQGAPLTPAFAAFLLEPQRVTQGAFVNLGGICNVTWVDRKNNKAIGYDVGPANALMDAWIWQHKQTSYDQNGAWASTGTVHDRLLQVMLDDPYLQAQYPKSIGRDYFSLSWLKQRIKRVQVDLAPEDVQATLLELTAQSLADALCQWANPSAKTPCYVHGKGVYNGALMARIAGLLPDYEVTTTHALSVPADWLETGLFAWLACCYRCKKKLDLRHATGAKAQGVLGACYVGG